MNMKNIKRLFLVICLLSFAALCTGCGEKVKTDIKVRSSSTADYSFSIGIDDEMLQALATVTETSSKDLINKYVKQGFTYSAEKSNGITYHVFTVSGKKAKLSQIEDALEGMGYTNVCLKKDYFFATYDPGDFPIATEDIEEIMDEYTKETGIKASDFHYYQTLSIQLKGNIKNTNGKISKSNQRCVTWTYKNYQKAKNFYASTSSTKKAATVKNIKNGKSYKIGKNGKIIKIANASSAARITLNRKAIKNGKIIKKAGRYSLTIWSKTGRCKTITFKITK